MTDCNHCNKIIKVIEYKCNYCGKLHCSKHRLPENHRCQELANVNFNEKPDERTPMYVPIFIDYDDLSLDSIYEFSISKRLNERETVKYLTYFLEESTDYETRKNAIIAFDALGLVSDKTFKILENCLVTDESIEVKDTAALILRRLFPKKSADALKWYYNEYPDLEST